MSLPYFPLYVTDYEADTAHRTILEDGAYNRLLRLCWTTPGCTIPDDEAWIMRRMRARTEDEKEAVRTVLDEFFQRKKGRVFQKKLVEIYESAVSRHEAAVNNGKKGGRPTKARKTNDSGKSYSKPGENQQGKPKKANQNQNQNHNTPLTPQGGQGSFLEPEKPPTPTPLSILSEVVPEDRAKAFIDMRRSIKKPMTVDAAKLAAAKLRKMPNPVDCINQSIMNSWQGLFPVKPDDSRQRPQSSVLAEIQRREAQGGRR